RQAVMKATTEKIVIHESGGVRSSSDCVGRTKLKTIINASKRSAEMATRLWNEKVVSGISLFCRARSSNQSQRIPVTAAALMLTSTNSSNQTPGRMKSHQRETARLKRMPAA